MPFMAASAPADTFAEGIPLLDRFVTATADALDACRRDDIPDLTRAVERRERAAAQLDGFFTQLRTRLAAGGPLASAELAYIPVARRLREAERLGRELEAAVQARRDALARELAAVDRDGHAVRGYSAAVPTPARRRLDRRF